VDAPRAACPRCETPPSGGALRTCEACDERFEPFVSGGACPRCARVWVEAWCPACRRWSPHEQWLRDAGRRRAYLERFPWALAREPTTPGRARLARAWRVGSRLLASDVGRLLDPATARRILAEEEQRDAEPAPGPAEFQAALLAAEAAFVAAAKRHRAAEEALREAEAAGEPGRIAERRRERERARNERAVREAAAGAARRACLEAARAAAVRARRDASAAAAPEPEAEEAPAPEVEPDPADAREDAPAEGGPSRLERWAAQVGITRLEVEGALATAAAGARSAYETVSELVSDRYARFEAGDYGAALLRRGEPAAAAAACGLVLARDPHCAQALENRGRARLALGDLAGAAGDLDRLVLVAPDSPEAYGLRARARLSLHDRAGALADAEEAVRLEPEAARAHLLRGEVRLARDEPEEAVADLDRALDLASGEDAAALAVRASAKTELGDLDAALADAAAAVERAPADPWIESVRAGVHLDRGEPADAERAYTRALRLGPARHGARSSRARARLDQGRLGPALADLTRALRADPDDLDARQLRAFARAAAGDEAGAREDLGAGLAAARGEGERLEALAWLGALGGAPPPEDAAPDDDAWARWLVRFVQGAVAADALRARAEREERPSRRRARVAQAAAFAGLLAERAGRDEEATERYREAVASGERSVFAVIWSALRLARAADQLEVPGPEELAALVDREASLPPWEAPVPDLDGVAVRDAEPAAPGAPAPQPAGPGPDDPGERLVQGLERLARLHADGVIDDAELADLKRRLLEG